MYSGFCGTMNSTGVIWIDSATMAPHVSAYLKELNERDEQAPGMRAEDNQTLYQYPRDLLLDYLLRHARRGMKGGRRVSWLR